MTMRPWRFVVLAALAALLAACGLGGPVALRTDASWNGGCAFGVGIDAVLHGSPTDSKMAWAEDRMSGGRLELIWPRGFTARFSQGLEILDRDGDVVGHEGDLLIGRCLPQEDDAGALRVDANQVRPPDWQPGDG